LYLLPLHVDADAATSFFLIVSSFLSMLMLMLLLLPLHVDADAATMLMLMLLTFFFLICIVC
jgi:hypothetical protein